MLEVGDKVMRNVTFVDWGSKSSKGAAYQTMTLPAEVVYIHPQQRFYTIRVKFPDGRSFCTTEYFYPRNCGK